MNGYLTRLAARNLNRTDTIEPRPASRYEASRYTVALNQDVHHVALERREGARSSDRTGQASTAARMELGPVPHPASEQADTGPLLTDMNEDSSRSAVCPGPVPRVSDNWAPLARERRPRLNQPLAPGYPRKAGMGSPLESDPDRSENHESVNVEKQSPDGALERNRQSRHADVYELQAGKEQHRPGKEAIPASYARIIPSVGAPASEQRTVAGPTAPQRPVIKVSIGRIDVRAVMPAPAAPKVRRERTQPSLSLDEYLSRRSGGSR
jgi:hypothetical protein